MAPLDPTLMAIVAGIVGWALNEWRRGRASEVKAVKVDADLLARLRTVEEWQRDHNSIHGCLQGLRATTEAMAKNVDRLTRRIDQWMAANPAPLRHPQRSPYAFAGARDWVLGDEDDDAVK